MSAFMIFNFFRSYAVENILFYLTAKDAKENAEDAKF
jgi:hypothetical protein